METYENSQNQIPPYETTQLSNSMATAAMVLGVASVLTFMTVYLPLILGSLAIILALLSKGYNYRMMPSAKVGIISGAVSFGSMFGILLLGISTIVSLFVTKTPEELISFGKQADATIESQLGEAPEELFGLSYEDMMRQILGMESEN